jgi:hypothetical protein
LVLAEALLRGGDWSEGRQELRRFVDEAPTEMSAEKSRASNFLGTRQQLSLPAPRN